MTTTHQETGGCLCGAYRYAFDRQAVLSAAHCHCTDCQRVTGSGKATIVFLPTAALEAKGTLKSYTVVGSDGSHVERLFCDTCGSPVLSRVIEQPDLIFVKAGSLDDSSWVNPAMSFWARSALPWDAVADGVPAVPGNPPAPTA
ncbi:MAG: GFA family protein [Pseudomonadota bacterium]